jgi:hypothetical protein
MQCAMHASHNAVGSDEDPALVLSRFIAAGKKTGVTESTVCFVVLVPVPRCAVQMEAEGFRCDVIEDVFRKSNLYVLKRLNFLGNHLLMLALR